MVAAAYLVTGQGSVLVLGTDTTRWPQKSTYAGLFQSDLFETEQELIDAGFELFIPEM